MPVILTQTIDGLVRAKESISKSYGEVYIFELGKKHDFFLNYFIIIEGRRRFKSSHWRIVKAQVRDADKQTFTNVRRQILGYRAV